MELLKNWRRVLKDAWSSRLIMLAAVLSGLEVILPLFVMAVPVGIFAVASFVVTAGALVARIVAQPSLHREKTDGQGEQR